MTSTLKKTISFVCVTGLLLACGVSGRAEIASLNANQLFGIASAYNNVFFGNYVGSYGDVEGHAAIGGNVVVNNYSFGAGQQAQHPTGPVLVVGGNITSNGVGVYDGDAYIRGSSGGVDPLAPMGTGPAAYNSRNPSYVGTPGQVYTGVTSLPFDFTVAKQQLTQVASDLWAMENTTSGNWNYKSWYDPNTSLVSGFAEGYTVDLRGLTGLQVVTVDALVFQNLVQYQAGFFNIYANADTTLIINVTDVTGLGFLNFEKEIYINGHNGEEWSDSYTLPFNGSNVLFNVDDSVAKINVGNAEINASILAVESHFNVWQGHVSGQVFGASAETWDGGEFHAYYAFDDKHFPSSEPPAVTPEPASVLIFGIGVAGAVGMIRRKKTGK